MKVWTVIENADYQTVAIFSTEELAREYCERMNPSFRGLILYDYGEEEVLDALPPEVAARPNKG